MKLHSKREIEYMNPRDYIAICTCGHDNSGTTWAEAETAIESHIEEENRILRIYVANRIYNYAEPGNGHVGNHEADGTYDRYLAIADYALARGFDSDA